MIHFKLQRTLKSSEGEMLLDVSTKIQQGTFMGLYGSSGAGKTSILRMLAGLMQSEKGLLEVNKKIWLDTSNKINLPPQKRSIGYVFQDYALFPNMTVKENLTYSLSKGQSKKISSERIDITELGELQHRKPTTLSGGQQQRVALARALVRQPEILLLDEPLSALDMSMRSKLQDYILKVHRQYNLTTILVSHDVSEVFKLCDQVLILEKGKIIQQGTPLEIFSNRKISGKFQFTGEIVHIQKEEVIYVVSVLIGNHLVKVVADASEVEEFSIGDKVLVASKAFNPLIQKIG